jgi:hypothetical protein
MHAFLPQRAGAKIQIEHKATPRKHAAFAARFRGVLRFNFNLRF